MSLIKNYNNQLQRSFLGREVNYSRNYKVLSSLPHLLPVLRPILICLRQNLILPLYFLICLLFHFLPLFNFHKYFFFRFLLFLLLIVCFLMDRVLLFFKLNFWFILTTCITTGRRRGRRLTKTLLKVSRIIVQGMRIGIEKSPNLSFLVRILRIRSRLSLYSVFLDKNSDNQATRSITNFKFSASCLASFPQYQHLMYEINPLLSQSKITQ